MKAKDNLVVKTLEDCDHGFRIEAAAHHVFLKDKATFDALFRSDRKALEAKQRRSKRKPKKRKPT